jgi:hypothetical protein
MGRESNPQPHEYEAEVLNTRRGIQYNQVIILVTRHVSILFQLSTFRAELSVPSDAKEWERRRELGTFGTRREDRLGEMELEREGILQLIQFLLPSYYSPAPNKYLQLLLFSFTEPKSISEL